MPVTADDVIHENTGTSVTSTSIVVSLAGADSTTAGNTVLVFLAGDSTGATPPAGFVTDKNASGYLGAYRKSNVAASETSWTFTQIAANTVDWYVVEMSGLDVEPLDASASNFGSAANGNTFSSGTTALNAGSNTVIFTAFMSVNVSPDWNSYTNSFTEVAEVTGTTGFHVAVARKFVDASTGTYSSTATLTSGSGAGTAAALVVVYRAADSAIIAPLALHAGFEWGTHGGMGNSGATSLHGGAAGPFGTWGTNYLIQAGSARNGSYGLRVVQSAATVCVFMGNYTFGSASVGFNARVVSGSGTPAVAVLESGTTDLYVLYDTSTTKFGLRWGTGGTPSWESGTTALNTWRWIDIRLKVNGTVYHADWRIETGTNTYTDQTSPADPTGQTANTFKYLQLGNGNASQTMTADYDDVIISSYYSAYPLGPHVVRLLVPETTGASVSGTSTNFSEFTANGTLAAFASTSGQRIDEVPPTISASSDGVVQTAVAASDYMNFPMGTYTCASDEIVAAVRALFSEWGGTGSGTGTIGYRGHDGTTETTFVAASASYDADSLTAASSTYPLWKCVMWPRVGGWTQAALDAAALRVGFSTDATPDMGISAAYLEVATRKAITARQITLEDPVSATVDLQVHPYSSSTVSYVITNNDATLSVNFNYSLSGTPQTPVTVGPSSNQTLQLNADAFGDVSDVSLEII